MVRVKRFFTRGLQIHFLSSCMLVRPLKNITSSLQTIELRNEEQQSACVDLTSPYEKTIYFKNHMLEKFAVELVLYRSIPETRKLISCFKSGHNVYFVNNQQVFIRRKLFSSTFPLKLSKLIVPSFTNQFSDFFLLNVFVYVHAPTIK